MYVRNGRECIRSGGKLGGGMREQVRSETLRVAEPQGTWKSQTVLWIIKGIRYSYSQGSAALSNCESAAQLGRDAEMIAR